MKRSILIFIVILAAAKAFAQTDKPDLIIQNQKTNPVYVPLGEQYTLSFTLRNIGAFQASAPGFKVLIPAGASYVSTNSIYPCNVQSGAVWCAGAANSTLGPGTFNNFSFVFNGASTVGPYVVWIEADPAGSNAEANETNNKASVGGQWFERPKLSVITHLCPAFARTVGQPYAFMFRLKNVGSTLVRYPGLKVDILGGPAMITSTVPQIFGAPTNISGNSRSLIWGSGLLNPGEEKDLTITMNSSAAHALSATATVEQENENTPADNVARCSFAVQ